MVCRFGLSAGSGIPAPLQQNGPLREPVSPTVPRTLPLLGAVPVVDVLANLVLGDAVPLLDLALKLVALAAHDIEIVVGQLAPLLLDLAFDLLPVSFDAIPIHENLLVAVPGPTAIARRRSALHPKPRKKPETHDGRWNLLFRRLLACPSGGSYLNGCVGQRPQ